MPASREWLLLYFVCYVQVRFERLRCQCITVGLCVLATLIAAHFLCQFYADSYRRKLIDFPPVPSVVRPDCSFAAFRRTAAYDPGGYLRGYGTWERNSRGKIVRFHPAICRLRYGMRIPPNGELTSCLHRQNIRYVVILGDSNGMRYFDALLWHLQRQCGVRCMSMSKNNIVNWTTYERSNMYVLHRCRCGSYTDSGRSAAPVWPACSSCLRSFHRRVFVALRDCAKTTQTIIKKSMERWYIRVTELQKPSHFGGNLDRVSQD